MIMGENFLYTKLCVAPAISPLSCCHYFLGKKGEKKDSFVRKLPSDGQIKSIQPIKNIIGAAGKDKAKQVSADLYFRSDIL